MTKAKTKDPISEPVPETAATVAATAAAGLSADQITALVTAIIAGQSAQNAEGIKALIAEQGRTQRKSNAEHPGISAFSYPEGDVARPKPKLNMDTFFCGVRIRENELTPAEIDLYNMLMVSKTSRNGKWSCDVQQVGNKKRRLINVPVKTLDNRSDLPSSLSLILMEFATEGADAINPVDLVAEVLKLREQVAALAAA